MPIIDSVLCTVSSCTSAGLTQDFGRAPSLKCSRETSRGRGAAEGESCQSCKSFLRAMGVRSICPRERPVCASQSTNQPDSAPRNVKEETSSALSLSISMIFLKKSIVLWLCHCNRC